MTDVALDTDDYVRVDEGKISITVRPGVGSFKLTIVDRVDLAAGKEQWIRRRIGNRTM